MSIFKKGKHVVPRKNGSNNPSRIPGHNICQSSFYSVGLDTSVNLLKVLW